MSDTGIQQQFSASGQDVDGREVNVINKKAAEITSAST
jgi:hypothetical protein